LCTRAALSPEFEKLYARFGRPSIPLETLLRALLLSDFLQCLLVFRRQFSMVRIKMHIMGAPRNLDHLDTAEQSQRRSLAKDISSRPAGPRTLLTITPAGLLIFDLKAVRFTPRLLPNEPHLPTPAFAGDIYPLDFVV
jgi:hypothetical protein